VCRPCPRPHPRDGHAARDHPRGSPRRGPHGAHSVRVHPRPVRSAPVADRYCELRSTGRGPRRSHGHSNYSGPFRRSPCSPFHRGRCTADNRRTALTTDQDHKPLVLHAPTDAEVLNEESINPFENSSFDSASRQTVDRWIQAKTKPLLLAYFM